MGRGTGKGKGKAESHRAAKELGKGVRIMSQTKIVVENVRRFFEKEKNKGHGKAVNVLERTADATGISTMTLKRIHREYIEQDMKFFTPLRRYIVSRLRVNPDSFDRAAIKRIVHAIYRQRQYPTIMSVLEKAKRECQFPGGRFCMWRVLKGTWISLQEKR